MKEILQKLYEHHKLTREEAKGTLTEIAQGAFPAVQLASFITVFQMRGIGLAELEGFRDALLELCVPLDVRGQETVDIVGTGGDHKDTFNISTLAAVVVAGAGYKVTKHGNYGASSAVGSSNVLQTLGYQFTNDGDTLRRQLDEANLCFLHAPLFHPALKEVAAVRRELGIRTFFNMLGPLVNPVQPTHQLYGTSSLELSRMYQYIMQQSGRRFAIVYALDGYDEISLTGRFKVQTNEGELVLEPEDLKQPRLSQADLYCGGTAEDAAKIFMNVLQNEATPAQKAVVTVNAGLAIKTMQPERTFFECVEEARESIESGKALNNFRKIVNV
ncbi:MAG: anthranilate phosphoribosyltransferase [Saprospiraceae bacterium]|nr:anthranilate phosphoribosyltransferase [Saprospiraceae bacterium]